VVHFTTTLIPAENHHIEVDRSCRTAGLLLRPTFGDYSLDELRQVNNHATFSLTFAPYSMRIETARNNLAKRGLRGEAPQAPFPIVWFFMALHLSDARSEGLLAALPGGKNGPAIDAVRSTRRSQHQL